MEEITNSTIDKTQYNTSSGDDEGLMSVWTGQIFIMINLVSVCSLVGLFGILTNSINMVVFCKQGFKNTMTISFMALAISDTSCLITLEWFNVCMNPFISRTGVAFIPMEIHSLTAAWPHVTFGRITGWITVYITAERCLCITAPLAVRNILTPTRTTCSLVVIYVVNILVIVPEYTTSYIGWRFHPDLNRSLLSLFKVVDNDQAEAIVFLLNAVLILTSFVFVTVLTSVLVVKLKVASQWRRQAAQGKAQSEAMSTKDKKATSMVVMISSLLIVMNTPGILLSLASFCEPKFSIYGVDKHLFDAVWSFAFVFNAINSSVNIFMYYNMSSRYREIFNKVFLERFSKPKEASVS